MSGKKRRSDTETARKDPSSSAGPRSGAVYTIGHSSQPLEAFLGLLDRHRIQALADVRHFPGSRAFPHFGGDALAANLAEAGKEYRWIESLGGRRSRQANVSSANAGLRNASFRNYADYMATEEFRQGIEVLLEMTSTKRTALMCAEAVYWRCHRRLISDYLTAHGVTVWHIFPDGKIRPHSLTEGAVVVRGKLGYPATEDRPMPSRS